MQPLKNRMFGFEANFFGVPDFLRQISDAVSVSTFQVDFLDWFSSNFELQSTVFSREPVLQLIGRRETKEQSAC